MRSLLVDLSPLRESPPFRRLFIARTVLLFGVGLVAVTVPLQVYAITRSSTQVGLVAAVEGFAFFFGFFWGGVLADTGNRWRLIRFGRVICFLSFLGLAINAWTLGAVWLTAVLVAANGLSGAVGITALLAVIPGLVEKSKMHAVGALNTLSLRLGAIAAPVAGGALVASAGPGWTYGLGAASALIAIPVGERAQPDDVAVRPTQDVPRTNPLTSMREGYKFIVSDRVVLGVMIGGVVGMLGGGSFVLVPVFVDAKFGDQPVVVGLVYSALSLGLLAGAVASGRLAGARRPGLLLLVMMIVSFGCYAAAGAAGTVVLVLVLVFVVAAGVSISVEEVLRYALLQLRSPESMLGRVNSVFSAQNMAGAAVGAMVAGAFGALVGAANVFWAYNVVMALASVAVLAMLPGLRRAVAAPG